MNSVRPEHVRWNRYRPSTLPPDWIPVPYAKLRTRSAPGNGTRVGERRTTRVALAVVLLLGGAAAIATVTEISLVTAQNAAVSPVYTTGIVPLDPLSPQWATATPVQVPLSAQIVAIPNGGGHIPTVFVRSIVNDTWIGFLLEWRDATRDVDILRAQDFADAVAIQVVATGGDQPPFVCMGQATFQAQIWHWRADRDSLAGGRQNLYDFYRTLYGDFYPFENETTFYAARYSGNFLALLNTTPVQVFAAGGPGTLTPTGVNDVVGAGVWNVGTWRVAMARRIAAAAANEVDFSGSPSMAVSFAAWDGANGDRDGQKSVSTWYDFTFPRPADLSLWYLIAAGVIALAVFIVFVWKLPPRKEPWRLEVPKLPRGLREPSEKETKGVSRRRLLSLLGLAGAGFAVGFATRNLPAIESLVGDERDPRRTDVEDDTAGWSRRRRQIDDAFESAVRDPEHLR